MKCPLPESSALRTQVRSALPYFYAYMSVWLVVYLLMYHGYWK